LNLPFDFCQLVGGGVVSVNQGANRFQPLLTGDFLQFLNRKTGEHGLNRSSRNLG